MEELSTLQKVVVWALPVLLAITLHEVAHGWVALRLGDRTAYALGRLSLNPLRHVDPVGTLVVPGLLLVLQTGFVFGWAKPVPVNYLNLHHPKRDMALVAAAGPTANLGMWTADGSPSGCCPEPLRCCWHASSRSGSSC
jgi:Zn-dependent protease